MGYFNSVDGHWYGDDDDFYSLKTKSVNLDDHVDDQVDEQDQTIESLNKGYDMNCCRCNCNSYENFSNNTCKNYYEGRFREFLEKRNRKANILGIIFPTIFYGLVALFFILLGLFLPYFIDKSTTADDTSITSFDTRQSENVVDMYSKTTSNETYYPCDEYNNSIGDAASWNELDLGSKLMLIFCGLIVLVIIIGTGTAGEDGFH